jgi:tetratricopeptide (TPR) repeat protein
LAQSAAYISYYQTSLADYLSAWERERDKVLKWHDKNVMQYPVSVAATWQTIFPQLCPMATAILRLASFLAPDPIPVEMFEAGESIVEEAVTLLCEETKEARGEQDLKDSLAGLASCCMVTREGATFVVHRLVQEVLRTSIPAERRRDWIERSLRLVDGYSPEDPRDVRTWPEWDRLRPHAAAMVQHADAASIASPTARLMNQLSTHLQTKSLYTEAEILIRRALEIMENSVGPAHSDVGICLNNLAQLLQDTNRLAEAEPLMRRALQIDQQAFNENHPNIAIRLNNLATLLQDTNRLTEAEPLMRRALQIDQRAFGEDHPEVATDLNNLAQLLKATNRLAEAEPLMRRVLQIDQQAFGEDHPEVATALNNLARLLQDTNRLAEAEPLMRRALAIFEQSLGPEHPNTGVLRGNLGALMAKIAEEPPQG